ncbi:MAG: hypothetical protein RLZZ224_148, partial [Verrucomicrobiota bacterium]
MRGLTPETCLLRFPFMSFCIWYGLYATPKHHNHNLAGGLIFGVQLTPGDGWCTPNEVF